MSALDFDLVVTGDLYPDGFGVGVLIFTGLIETL